MDLVLTLVSPTPDQSLLSCAAQTAGQLMQSYGLLQVSPTGQASENTPTPEILSPNTAWDIYFRRPSNTQTEAQTKAQASKSLSAHQLTDLRQQLRRALSGLPLDHALQNAEQRTKKLLLADMDSTLITVECIDELADYAGIKDDIARITEDAMQGKIDFEASLTARVALLKGLDAAVLERCFQERVTLSPGADLMAKSLKTAGVKLVLVSGGFTFFTERVAQMLGFSRHVSNQLEIKDGRLTGRVLAPVSGPATKENVLREEQQALSIAPQDVIAVGDGANDIPMLQAAGLGVAHHAKEKTAHSADCLIQHTDLASIPLFMGFKAS